MSLLSNLIKQAAPIVAAVAPGTPIGTAAKVVSVAQARQNQEYQRKLQQEGFDRRRNQNMVRYNEFGDVIGNPNLSPEIITGSTMDSGRFSGFGNFLSDVSSNIISPISGLFGGIKPFFSNQSSGQPALSTDGISGGQETMGSGMNNAFVGGLPNILGQAGRFLKTPTGSGLIGGATGLASNLFGGGGQKMRITRKMKSQYRSVLNLNMGSIELASQMLGVSPEMFVQVLLKRFRNDGAVVTKAALRKTKRTVNRLKGMCDMYDSLRPSATRRKAPMRRASTTLISNK